jgi:uncharacterized protein
MKNSMQKIIFLIILMVVISSNMATAQDNDALIKACATGNIAEVKSLVEKGADVNYKNATLTTAIFFPDVVQYLVEKGAKVNVGNYPPLVLACLYGSSESIKILLDAGADPNLPATPIKKVTNYGMTHLVTETNCLDCMKMMIAKGAKMDILNTISGANLLSDFGTSGRSKKARTEFTKVKAKSLVDYGMTIPDWYLNPDESKMGTPDEIVKLLVSSGVNINAVNKLKLTPLQDALVVIPSIVQPEVILAMINNGSNVNVESVLWGKPLLIAAGNGQVDVMDALIAKGANINDEFSVMDAATGQGLKGITLLMWAAVNDHLEAVKFLIAKGINLKESAYGLSVNMKTKCATKVEGKNAMYYAIESGNIEIVNALLETGAYWGKALTIIQKKQKQDIGALTITTCFSGSGYIPSFYAKACGFPEIQKLLKAKLI